MKKYKSRRIMFNKKITTAEEDIFYLHEIDKLAINRVLKYKYIAESI
jgi:hypothetical protein